MSIPEPERDPLARLLEQGSAQSDAEKLAARRAFLARLDEAEERRWAARTAARRWLVPVAAAAAVLLAVFFAWPERSVGYEVAGAPNEGGYVHASASEPAVVRFTDATELTALPGTRLRIGETRPYGADVSVEQGKLEANVTHVAESDWRFVAGPFQVYVTGTRFELGWDAQRERLEVVLLEGSVDVEGYSGSGRVSVKAGQRFVGDARARTISVTDHVAAPVTVAEPEQVLEQAAPVADGAEDAAVAPPAPSSDSTAPSVVRSPGAPTKGSWAKWVAKGEFQRVVDDATAFGTARCLASCDASDLVALSDAARYTGHEQLAEQSLLALRKRFASAAGSRAAFLLGRLHEGQGRKGTAREWYETALREAPSGSFASEALAGKMRMVSALEGKASARPIAEEYLQRFPTGVHAARARQLADRP